MSACQSCNAAMINGVRCHEHGCHEAWRDKPANCKECGQSFQPHSHYAVLCDDCKEAEDLVDDISDTTYQG